jgi:phage gpG-like protein
MITVKMDLSGIKDLLKKYRNGFVKGVRESMLVAEKWSKQSFGQPGHLKSRTGNLRRSINTKVIEEPNKVIGIIGTPVKYGAIHEVGGIIKPIHGKYLKFAINGNWKSVRQSVIPARPYLRPSISENQNKIREIIIRNVAEESNK